MEKPKLVLMSDDNKACNSKLEVLIKDNNTVKFNHTKLSSIGDEGIYSLQQHQIKELIRFLQEANDYITSNYDPILKPKGLNEFKNIENE